MLCPQLMSMRYQRGRNSIFRYLILWERMFGQSQIEQKLLRSIFLVAVVAVVAEKQARAPQMVAGEVEAVAFVANL